MSRRDGLKDRHRDAIIEILAAHPRVDRALLFGSRAMGTHSPESDIDITLDGAALAPDDLARLSRQLDALDVPQEVDLLLLRSIQSPALRDHIRRHGVDWLPHRHDTADTSTTSENRAFIANDLIKQGILEIGDGYRAKNAEMASDGLPFVRVADIKDGIRTDGVDLLGWPSVEKAGSKVSRPGDVVFTAKGTVGRHAFVTRLTPRFVYSPQLCYWRSFDHDFLDPRFLYYWIQGPDFLAQAAAVKGQTDMADYVSLRDMRRISLRLPPLPEQRRIAIVLGALDDKIELNRRMNETLEEMAQAIFKSWFIDFDGHTGLVDSELGPIPKGWKVSPLPDIIQVNPRTKLRKGTTATYVEMSVLSTTGPTVERTASREFKGGGSKFALGDTLLARITPCLENGKTALVDFLAEGEVAFGSTEFIVLRPTVGFSPEFVYCLARSEELRQFAINNMTGSTGRQRVPPDSLRSFGVAVPESPESVHRFSEVAAPMFARISANARQSRTLTELRDTLLPKLISGEIRVPEAEEILENQT